MAGWNPTARPEALPRVGGPQGNPGGSPTGTPGGPNASTSAKGWAGKNRTTLLAAGAAGVVLLALVMKSRGGASNDDSAAAAGTMTSNPNPQNLAAYDSSSSDVYNAIQPQLEQLQDLFTEWKTGKDAMTTVPVTAAPVTTPTTAVPVPVVNNGPWTAEKISTIPANQYVADMSNQQRANAANTALNESLAYFRQELAKNSGKPGYDSQTARTQKAIDSLLAQGAR